MNEILRVQDLSRSFYGEKVLDGLTFSVEKGKIVGLLAPNGKGKTTLIRLIMGLLTEDSGRIIVDGKPVSEKTNAIISYLPDSFVFGSFSRIKDAIKYMAVCYSDFDTSKAHTLLSTLHFDEKQKFSSMSKGQKEQVQLALFLSRKAKLYLLDEPLAAVDPATRSFIISTILSSFGEDNTVIISTQLVLDIEKILDEVIILKDGKVALSGEADALREEYGKTLNDIFIEQFRFM